jgi:hypothetical protein
MAYSCLGIRLTLVMCLMLDIKLTLYQNFIYIVSYNRENSFQSYIIQQDLPLYLSTLSHFMKSSHFMINVLIKSL